MIYRITRLFSAQRFAEQIPGPYRLLAQGKPYTSKAGNTIVRMTIETEQTEAVEAFLKQRRDVVMSWRRA